MFGKRHTHEAPLAVVQAREAYLRTGVGRMRGRVDSDVRVQAEADALLDELFRPRFWQDDFGRVLRNVHSEGTCWGEHCPIHRPSERAERIGLRSWRADRGFMERVCRHGVGHPDPDDHFADDIHGCDGCCSVLGPQFFAASDCE